MTRAGSDPWNFNWTIVRSDLDIAHVMLPLSNFRFESASLDSRYRLKHKHQAPVPDCFCEVDLAQIGTETPSLKDVIGVERLPYYDEDSAGQYTQISATMATYMTKHPQVVRLEGIVRIPCHGHGAKIRDGALAGHPPLTVKTLVQFYQFPNAVTTDTGTLSLLVVRTPLSPTCPMNGGDGTAVGVGHN